MTHVLGVVGKIAANLAVLVNVAEVGIYLVLAFPRLADECHK